MQTLNDPSFIRILEDLIRDIVQQEIKKARFNKMFSATVTSVAGNGLLTVELDDDGVSVPGVLNRTGETIIANDGVYILKINNSSSNYCATIKK